MKENHKETKDTKEGKRIASLSLFSIFLVIVVAIGCKETQKNSKTKGSQDIASTTTDGDRELASFQGYDLDHPDTILALTDRLKELSGLTTTPDGRLFGHNDEHGVVYEIDPKSGEIIKRWGVGNWGLEEDFEGITVVDDTFWLVTSKGDLFQFKEGSDQENVDFTQYKTDLTSKFDVEGLCYDSSTHLLLLLCKEYPGKNYDKNDEKTVYAFSLAEKTIDSKAKLVINAKKIRKALKLDHFKPSGIERHPSSDSYVVISSNQSAIVEIDPTGDVLKGHKLKRSTHPQPEGIAFGVDGQLLIGNESGRLVTYRLDHE